jgi:hypothetical protein
MAASVWPPPYGSTRMAAPVWPAKKWWEGVLGQPSGMAAPRHFVGGGLAGEARSGVHFFAIFSSLFFKKSEPPEGKKK